MKKVNLLWAAAASAMLFSACSDDDSLIDVPEDNSGEQIITLQVANLNGVTSRAGRPMLGSNNTHEVENVKIILTDANGNVVWTSEIDDWQTSADYSDGKMRKIGIDKKDFKMEAGAAYSLYAVGYSNGSEYTLNGITGVKKGESFDGDNVVIAYHGDDCGEEIFAGETSFNAGASGTQVSVELTRQVAGVFAYVEKIPYVTDAQNRNPATILTLRTSSVLNRSLALGVFDMKYTVNGTSAGTGKEILKVDLKDWFTEIKPNKENVLDFDGDNWKVGFTGKGKKYKKGSVFAGTFMIPFQKVDGNTLELVLSNEQGTAQRTWIVTLPDNVPGGQLEVPYTLNYWTYGWKTTASVTDTKNQYNILRNNVYGIGRRFNPDITDPDTPGSGTDPEPENPDDKPTPLNNKQELEILINHNWNIIYDLGVE